MALAKPGDDLVLADGSVVSPDGKVRKPTASRYIPVPSNTQAVRAVTRANKRLSDLPALPGQLNIISVVLSYTMWGLSDLEIALAANTTVERIKNIREHEAYARMHGEIVTNILAQDGESVRELIAQHARDAAMKIVELKDSEDDVVALRASADILDRAGHRPTDVVEHRHSMESGLRIQYVKQDNTKQLPIIDLEVE